MSRHSEYAKYRVQERRAEHDACRAVAKFTHTDVFLDAGQPVEWPSVEGGNEVTVRTQDIFNAGTWKKFMTWKGYNSADFVSLTENAEPLAREYDAFLDKIHKQIDSKGRHNPKPTRYNQLDTEGKVWRYLNCFCTAKWYILNYKSEGYNHGEPTFVDSHAAYYVSLILTIKECADRLAQVAGHVLKNPEAVSEEIAKFTQMYYESFCKVNKKLADEMLRMLDIDEIEEGDVNE